MNPRSDRKKIEDTIMVINSYLDDVEGGDDIIDDGMDKLLVPC